MGILLEYNCTLIILRNITVYSRNIEVFKTLYSTYVGNTDDTVYGAEYWNSCGIIVRVSLEFWGIYIVLYIIYICREY
jgi:zona occludens toxin (predicted ATPase)